MIQLTFTSQQMREFIGKTGIYNIESITVNYSYTEYHNRVVDEERQIEIAYPKEVPLKNFIANKTYIQLLDWSLSTVFEKVLKEKLLNL